MLWIKFVSNVVLRAVAHNCVPRESENFDADKARVIIECHVLVNCIKYPDFYDSILTRRVWVEATKKTSQNME